MSWIRACAITLALAAFACKGKVTMTDAAPPAADAALPADAGPPPSSTVDLTSAGGRMSGGSYTLDFQIGHPADQGRATGDTTTLEGGAAVRP